MSTFTGRAWTLTAVDFRLSWTFDRSVTPYPPRLCIVAACLSILLLGPPKASAEEGEHAFSAGVALLTMTHPAELGPELRLAPVGEVGYRYAIDDFWELGAKLSLGVSLGGRQPEAMVGHGFFESRYVIDALTWVPYLCFGVGALVRQGGPRVWAGSSGPSVDISAHAGLGVEWRPARAWSLGVEAKYVIAFSDIKATTGPIQLGFSASFYLD